MLLTYSIVGTNEVITIFYSMLLRLHSFCFAGFYVLQGERKYKFVGAQCIAPVGKDRLPRRAQCIAPLRITRKDGEPIIVGLRR